MSIDSDVFCSMKEIQNRILLLVWYFSHLSIIQKLKHREYSPSRWNIKRRHLHRTEPSMRACEEQRRAGCSRVIQIYTDCLQGPRERKSHRRILLVFQAFALVSGIAHVWIGWPNQSVFPFHFSAFSHLFQSLPLFLWHKSVLWMMVTMKTAVKGKTL